MKYSMPRPRLPTLALLALNVVFLGFVIWRLVAGTQTTRLLNTPSQTFTAPRIELAMQLRQPDLAVIQDQAVFHASRRFFVPPDPAAAPATPPPPDCKLAGVFLIPKKPAVALLACATGISRKVTPGEDLDGWTVQSIDRRRVVLQYADHNLELTAEVGALASGLQRVSSATQATLPRTTGGVRVLGAGGTSATNTRPVPQTSSDARLYRPPPQ